ncbi:MAG: helix-turn-helix transcriptional regulator [Bacillota bacterium]|nr:helix-turn-helix transcriptional regulator [Bacillota bacterium]
MKRVSDVVIVPTDLEEKLDFNQEIPHTVHLKLFGTEDIVPLHYSETIEILLCDQLDGTLVIDGKSYRLFGHQVFVIPPLIVHANHIKAGPGRMFVIKVSLENLAHFIDIPAILQYRGLTVSRLAHTGPVYTEIEPIVRHLIEHDDDIFARMTALIDLFALLCRHTTDADDALESVSRLKSSFLKAVITWTLAHHPEPISLTDVTHQVGYSKSHFCHLFKELTHMTWTEYLHSVRISAACRYLQDGMTVSQAGERSGFNNLSHFIRIFRQNRGMTPKAYRQQHAVDQ